LGNDTPTSICSRKSVISYFWITTFAVFAANYGADNIRLIIDLHGIRGAVPYIAVPFVFFITLLRFSIGNILHIRNLEKKEVSSFVWLFDSVVIFFESLFFLLLGMYSWGNDLRFLKLLMVLCFLDALWVVTMISQYMNGKLPERPKPLPWVWCLLNILSGLYLIATIWYDLPYPFPSDNGYIVFVLWFLVSAIIDVMLIDHYKLLRHLD